MPQSSQHGASGYGSSEERRYLGRGSQGTVLRIQLKKPSQILIVGSHGEFAGDASKNGTAA
jgi:hypothetical protein